MKFGNIEDKNGIDFNFKPLCDLSISILDNLPNNNMVKFHFGAPVWSDKNYKGTLYPNGTKAKDFLKEYARQFNSIEVNATRYGTPKQQVLERWLGETDKDFTFSMKFPQVITHRKNIMEDKAKVHLERFLVALDFLEAKRGISFAVMAGYFKPNNFNLLRDFIDFLPKDVPFAIELRAKEWFEDEIIKNEWHHLFIENNIIPVITDTPGRRDVMHFRIVNQHLFVRFVGGVHNSIDKSRIKLWAQQLAYLTTRGITDIWFYAHVSGDNRQDVVPFNNALIKEINALTTYNIPCLVDYSK